MSEIGMKFDDDKPRMDLLPPLSMIEVAKVLKHGADKYEAENWRLVTNPKARYLAAGLRHIFAHMCGEYYDDDSGLPHLAHAICGFMFMLELDLLEDT
jgi:hypothetical protein